MKKIIVIVVSLAFAIASLSGLSVASEMKPMTIKLANAIPEKSWFGQQHNWWKKEVEKRSGGKIKVKIFWMNSLVKWKDALPGIQSGMADMAWVSSTYFPSQLPNYLMLDNMFNYGDDYVASVLALIDTVANEPNLKAELKKENIVLLMPHISGHALIGTKKCPETVKDIKGLTIRTYGGVRTDFYKGLGANPVFMSFSDLYEAMSRGTIDAIGDLATALASAFKLYEVVDCMYHYRPGGALASGFYMNKKLFNSFPKDIQKMFIDLRKEYGIRYAQTLMDDEVVAIRNWKKHGVKFVPPSPEDEKFILKVGNAANEGMIKKQEAAGHKGVRNVWNYYLKARKKYEDQRAKGK